MRILVIDEDVRARAARVIAYAEKNPFRPGQPPPGDNPELTLQIGTFRVVFSRTLSDGLDYRDLSVSVPGGLYPGPEAVFMIASDLFGFTGFDPESDKPPDDWALDVVKAPVRYIRVVQAVGTTLAREKLS